MTGSLKQLNISYQPKEDRLLLKASTTADIEYRVWLTRRFTSLLLRVLTQQMDKIGGVQAAASQPQTLEHLKSGAFNQPYEEPSGSHFPLGEEGILAFRINAGDFSGGSLKLQLLPEEGAGVNFALDKSMLYMFHNLLEQGVSKTDWNLQDQIVPRERLH